MPYDSVLVPADGLRAIVTDVLVHQGARPADAALQAAVWVEADLRDQPSHGIQRLPTMLGRISNGQVNCAANPRCAWLSESVLDVDGDAGFGPVVASLAVEQITARAQAVGMALALVRRANHLGMLAPYVEKMAMAGCIGVALTTSEALVHPWGGAVAMLGTNPIAIAVPAHPERPLVLDMATSATSAGKIRHLAMKGQLLDEGWGVDSTGRSTTEPSAVIHGGSISPFGGAKGYGLGLVLGVVVAALTGTAFGPAVTGTLDEDQPATKGDLLISFDPVRLGKGDVANSVAQYLDEVRASRLAVGEDSIAVPGDRARQRRDQRIRDGIPVGASLWRTLAGLSEAAGGTR